jgi:hypothetical protein
MAARHAVPSPYVHSEALGRLTMPTGNGWGAGVHVHRKVQFRAGNTLKENGDGAGI